ARACGAQGRARPAEREDRSAGGKARARAGAALTQIALLVAAVLVGGGLCPLVAWIERRRGGAAGCCLAPGDAHDERPRAPAARLQATGDRHGRAPARALGEREEAAR